MVTKIDLSTLPLMAEKRLYLDYLKGDEAALDFFTHTPLDFSGALASRREHDYPRQELVKLVRDYHATWGAHAKAMNNIEALGDPETFCVIGGQQAGFLGGPVYTCYKIITTIRLAHHLQAKLGRRIVPVFWLASEDHDFDEINHAHYVKPDGEIGDVHFDWEMAGRPIADMPISAEIKHAYESYFEKTHSEGSDLKRQFAPRSVEMYSTWQARVWSQLFAEHGLVLVEPRILRPAAGDFFQRVLEHSRDIEQRLEGSTKRLRGAGYQAVLEPGRAGRLYTFDSEGFRVRVAEPQNHLEAASRSPEHYSTDVALRPLLADSVLPILVSVLGPGETAYHAMLRPIYDLFSLPQPLYYPRKGYTVLAEREVKRLADYQTDVTDIMMETLDTDAVFRGLMPTPAGMDQFDRARAQIEAAFAPLQSYVEEIDPNLGKAWSYGLSNALRGLDNLEQGTFKAKMSQMGFSRGELRRLSNLTLPRERLQERVFPLPHFLNRYGSSFIEAVFSTGAIDDFCHHILQLEAEYDRS